MSLVRNQVPTTLHRMLYFGYGSNLLAARVERRLGYCERLGAASLAGYALKHPLIFTGRRTFSCTARARPALRRIRRAMAAVVA